MSVLVIAEIGVNHDGRLDKGLELIEAAFFSGADAVKFQTYRTDLIVTSTAPKADYQKSRPGQNQLDLLKSLELSKEDFRRLSQRASSRGIEFLSTGFEQESVDFLVDLGMERIKIPSGEITNLPLLRHIGKKRLPVLLSSGMADLGEIESAIEALESSGTSRENITVLHCTTDYPAQFEDTNLRALETIRKAFSVSIGYSDHTLGSEVAIAATALGSEVIEKHITLDKTLPGPDHAASMEPDEFSRMVKSIRNVEAAMGDGIKKPGNRELLNIPVARKSLVASRPIRLGEKFSAYNVTAKRPGTGVSPMMWDVFIGRIARRDYQKDELIEW